ncbi:FkbM family methyltransferase [filamentous cyanobacterium CCP3]|nr:FkbM family methyltransferase [filamentous cyanobacterium CCP3]
MTFISYAQNYEDVMLWRALQEVSSGFYIDIGAAWPDVHSVTEAFYQRGWHGINVEPNPELFSQLNSKRQRDINLQLAISSQNGEAEISIIKDTGLSTFREDIAKQHIDQGWSCSKINVVTKTLSSLWQDYVPEDQDVHFLKLDVEGYEGIVIESNDWTKNRPWIVVVESTLPLSQSESYEAWQYKLLDCNYKFIYADGLNRFYLANEHSGLSSCFTYPPNYFDRFQLASQSEAEAQLSRIKNLNQQLSSQNQQLSSQNQRLSSQNQKLSSQNQQLSEDLHLLVSSRSMRITKPLRALLNFARHLRYWIECKFVPTSNKYFRTRYLVFDANDSRLLIKEPTLLLKRFYNIFFNKSIQKMLLSIYKNPKANRIIRRLVKSSPQLELFLKRVYMRAIYSTASSELRAHPKELSHLSFTARRIYSDLKKAVEKHREGDY